MGLDKSKNFDISFFYFRLFSLRDVKYGGVNYVQSIHKGVEPVGDRLGFYCTDGSNRTPKTQLVITITPSNDETPQVGGNNQS